MMTTDLTASPWKQSPGIEPKAFGSTAEVWGLRIELKGDGIAEVPRDLHQLFSATGIGDRTTNPCRYFTKVVFGTGN